MGKAKKRTNRVGAISTYIRQVSQAIEKSGDSVDILFRGQSSIDYRLAPSISRKDSFLHHESELITLAKNRRPDVFANNLQPLELLALLQHYGIPTRLLDVTESALVALYFACLGYDNKPKKDGAVYIFKNDSSRTAKNMIYNAVADTAFIQDYSTGSEIDYEEYVAALKKQPYWIATVEGKKAITHSSIGVDLKTKLRTPLFVDAPALALRQHLQHGKYILFPNDSNVYPGYTDQYYFINNISPIAESDPIIINKIIIAHENKSRIIRELATLGITEANLFGDSIDYVCKGIKEMF